tara:strand:+ start:1 stop:963 length:963 start_codon:yes stop_codon:yes gene_type:complete
MDENLEILVKTINSTETLFGEQFNNHPDALNAYAKLFGQEKLKEVLESKNDLHLNAFYSVPWCFEKEVEKRNIPTEIVKHYIDQIEHQPRKNHILISLIETAAETGEIDKAESWIEDISEEKFESKFHGHRVLLKYYAEQGDLKEFKKNLKLSKPAKSPRNVIFDAKYRFVVNYSKENGVSDGLELLSDKIFGTKFCLATIEGDAHNYSLDQINKLVTDNAVYEEHDPFVKPWLIVRHFSNQRPTVISTEDFTETISLILTVDKSVKRGDGRLRDYMLYDIGSSVKDVEQIKECKKHVIDPFYKRELNYHLKNLNGEKFE